MKNIDWKDGYITIEQPAKPKKITGTKFAALLGYNHWQTPFATWCDLTRTYEKPYEDTVYTNAGKVIEPIQHQYMRDYYGLNLYTPEDAYGKNYFEITHGDFYPTTPIFGGMWDALVLDGNKVDAVVEFKTTSRPEDWEKDLPDYYGLQASLYAYLLGIEKVIMVASFLDTQDYERPFAFQPSVSNTIVKIFNVHERYPKFDEYIERAKYLYENMTVSPYYDETKDADTLKALKTDNVESKTLNSAIESLAQLKGQIDKINDEAEPLMKAYKALQERIKGYCLQQFTEHTDTVSASAAGLTVTVSKSVKSDIDKKRLQADGLLEKYTVEKEIYTLRVKEEK